MRRLLLAILAVMAMPTMFHLAKMEVSHAQAAMSRSHHAESSQMPDCPAGFVCPVRAERFSAGGGVDAPAPNLTLQMLAVLAAIPLALAFASRGRYRAPLAVPIPTDPKVALSTFKRE